jgi:hypothetical protein
MVESMGYALYLYCLGCLRNFFRLRASSGLDGCRLCQLDGWR